MEAFISGDVLLFLIIIAGIAWLIYVRSEYHKKEVDEYKKSLRKGGRKNNKSN